MTVKSEAIQHELQRVEALLVPIDRVQLALRLGVMIQVRNPPDSARHQEVTDWWRAVEPFWIEDLGHLPEDLAIRAIKAARSSRFVRNPGDLLQHVEEDFAMRSAGRARLKMMLKMATLRPPSLAAPRPSDADIAHAQQLGEKVRAQLRAATVASEAPMRAARSNEAHAEAMAAKARAEHAGAEMPPQ